VLCLAEERIWLKAEINDTPVRLCFDSGSNVPILSSRGLRKLGLKFVPGPTNSSSLGSFVGKTDECTLALEGARCKTSFYVLGTPRYTYDDFDGLIGWGSLDRNVVQVDAVAGIVTFLSEVPADALQWIRLPLMTNFGTLDLQITQNSPTNGVLCVDTGTDGGIALPREEWLKWGNSHAHTPRTLETLYNPQDGFVVREEAWADLISIGPLAVTGVPVASAGRGTAARWGNQYEYNWLGRSEASGPRR
jgi:hypothetical protein